MKYSIDLISSYLDEYDYIKKIILYIKNASNKIKMYKIVNNEEVLLNNEDIETYISSQFFSSGTTINTSSTPEFYFKINNSIDIKIHRKENLSKNITYAYNYSYYGSYSTTYANFNSYFLSIKYFRSTNSDKFERIYIFPFSNKTPTTSGINYAPSQNIIKQCNLGYIDGDNYLELFFPNDFFTSSVTNSPLTNFNDKHMSIKFIKDSNDNNFVGIDGKILNDINNNINNNSSNVLWKNHILESSNSCTYSPSIINCGFFCNTIEDDNIYIRKIFNYDYNDLSYIDFLDGYELLKVKNSNLDWDIYDFVKEKSIYNSSNAPEYRIITIENNDYFNIQYNLLLPINNS